MHSTNISEIFYAGRQEPDCDDVFKISNRNKIHVYVSSQYKDSSFCGLVLQSKDDDEL